jgi:hypothetical protein
MLLLPLLTDRKETLRFGVTIILLLVTLGDVAYASARDTDSSAASAGTDIRWEAPAECPDANSVKLSIERLLGQSLDGLQDKNVRAHGEVRRNYVGNWELHCVLSVGDRVEEETLAAKKCQALADAMALKVALAIDPLAVAESVEPAASAVPPAAPATPPPAPIRIDSVRNQAPRPARGQPGLRLVGGVGLGPLPSMTGGAGAYASLQLPSFRVELGGQGYWGGVARYAALPSIGGHFQLFSGAARACFTPGSGYLTVPVCAGLEAGTVRGEGFGTASAETTSGLWAAAVLGPAFRIQVTRVFAIWLEADALLTILRPEFHVRNLDTLYTPPWGGSRASAGLEVVLGR